MLSGTYLRLLNHRNKGKEESVSHTKESPQQQSQTPPTPGPVLTECHPLPAPVPSLQETRSWEGDESGHYWPYEDRGVQVGFILPPSKINQRKRVQETQGHPQRVPCSPVGRRLGAEKVLAEPECPLEEECDNGNWCMRLSWIFLKAGGHMSKYKRAIASCAWGKRTHVDTFGFLKELEEEDKLLEVGSGQEASRPGDGLPAEQGNRMSLSEGILSNSQTLVPHLQRPLYQAGGQPGVDITRARPFNTFGSQLTMAD